MVLKLFILIIAGEHNGSLPIVASHWANEQNILVNKWFFGASAGGTVLQLS